MRGKNIHQANSKPANFAHAVNVADHTDNQRRTPVKNAPVNRC